MPIKNSLKIFASKFSMVYSILLYLVIATVVLASVSVFALIPVYRFLEAEGVTAKAGDVITKLVINGYSSELFDQVVECLERIAEVMRAKSDLVVLTVLYFTLFIGLFCRLVYGMLELPMLKKIKGAMSDNADYGFIGLYVSCFGKSFIFSLCKIMLKILSDTLVLLGVLFLSKALMFSSAKILIPFIDCVILVAYFTFSHCVTACWGASVATDGRSIFGSLKLSWKIFFSESARFYGTFVITAFLLLGINFFIARYTFGAGIIISLPVSIYLVYILDMTYFYTKRGYRYYVAGEIAGEER